MLWIRHRMNQISQLNEVDPSHGVEIDLRSDVHQKGHLHLSHDPWVPGDSFDLWLDHFQVRQIKGPILFNTKEDGLEPYIFEKIQCRGLQNQILFLDTAFPTLIQWVKKGLGKYFLIRVSKYEDLSMAMRFQSDVQWLWLDCFDGQPLPLADVQQMSQKFQLCLVSPELQKQDLSKIDEFQNLRPWVHAICTKSVISWR